jgi:hypothetical protein
MSIELFDPVGEPEQFERVKPRTLAGLEGKRVGYVFNQHVSALAFWDGLEAEVGRILSPEHVTRVHKTNTWAPAPRVDAERVLAETDYVLVGVGA